MARAAACAVLLLLAGTAPAADDTVPLTVTIRHVDSSRGGACIVSLYDSPEGFLETPLAEVAVRPDDHGVAVARFPALTPGLYAVTVIHDRNGNGSLDQGLFGVPKEPYGFSRGYRPRFRAPHFDEVQFEVSAPGTDIEITLP